MSKHDRVQSSMPSMQRILVTGFILALLVAALVAAGYAETKSYQFTGIVKASDGGSVTVEKTAKEGKPAATPPAAKKK